MVYDASTMTFCRVVLQVGACIAKGWDYRWSMAVLLWLGVLLLACSYSTAGSYVGDVKQVYIRPMEAPCRGRLVLSQNLSVCTPRRINATDCGASCELSSECMHSSKVYGHLIPGTT